MQKQTPKRRLNRRVRRLIRRSVASLLMITAILVAAIPVPDIKADDGLSKGASNPEKRQKVEKEAGNAETSGDRKRVSYKVDEADYLNKSLTLLNPASGSHSDPLSKAKTFTIKQLSNGEWKYNWQFEFYVVNNESVTTESGTATATGGIISQYNKDYDEEIVELQAVNPLEYYEIKVDDYNSFYDTGKGSGEFSLIYADYEYFKKNGVWSKKDDENFLKLYFNQEYQDFINQCIAYHDAPDDNKPGVPTPITKRPKDDFNTAQKYSYFCDTTFSGKADPGALTLVYALDGSMIGTSTSSSYLYLVRLADGKDSSALHSEMKFDKDGFICKSMSSEIIGIADEAFKGVTKIDTLVLPEEIRYIGDSAFEGSFLKSISLNNVSDIGNKTFKNCSQLVDVKIGTAVNVIGAEAFSGSSITELCLPYSVKKIGPGAFSFCHKLKTVNLNEISAGNNANIELGKFAFFDCCSLDDIAMSESGITSIGEGAFAATNSITGNLQSVILPKQIKDSNLHDFLFDGRNTLKSVTFPENYGYTGPTEIPQNMFRGCSQLEEVVFPDQGNGTCGFITYKPYLFLDVINHDFVVSGPEKDLNGNIASPRKSTWSAITAVSDFIPYKYKDQKTGLDYYEVSDGIYLLTANNNGVLTSCTLNDGASVPAEGLDIVIPQYVGNYKISSLDTNCFSDDKLKKEIRSITIEDESLTEISNSTFEGLPRLESVIIGNSVTRVGDSAFANCPNLTDVTFNSPLGNNYSTFTIGADAFKTGSSKLTFHGDINEDYAPFKWAMSPDNFIDSDLGIRVCYKSLSPSNLTVLYNNATKERTLVNYPKYRTIDQENQDFINKMQNTYYEKYRDTSFDGQRAAFQSDWNASGEAAYDGSNYGPWVNSTWINGETFTGSNPEPYFEKFPYSIKKNFEKPGTNEWQALTPLAESWVKSTIDINIPDGIDSIDVKGYMEDSSNAYNKNTYLAKGDGLEAVNHDMYTNPKEDPKDNETSVPGLFSGYYEDYDMDTPNEEKYRGNDCVEEITFNSVKELPDFAFDSCENLKKVNLGPLCECIGNTPFRGCDNLSEVVFENNPKYTSNKGIIYSINDDGSYTIEECLPYRGNDPQLAPPVVNLETDPDLANVTSIKEGAFEDCNNITAVDLSKCDKLDRIPQNTFKNCDILSRVFLPEKVNRIEEGAFLGDKNGLTVTIPGKEVHIETDAFEHTPQVTLRSYKDSAAHEYADYHKLNWENLASNYQVVFLDYDGTQLGETQFVEEGGNAVPPENPSRDGWTFVGWNKEYTAIKSDTILVAQYKQNGSGGGGNDPSKPDGDGTKPNPDGKPDDKPDGKPDGKPNNPDGIVSDGKSYTVTVIGGNGGGSYLSGSTVKIISNSPAAGKKFRYWSSADGVAFSNTNSATTTFTMPRKNVTVTANFDSSSNANNGSSVSGNTGGNKGNRVTINRPGISNGNISSIVVNGSSDNFIVRISDSAEATKAVEAALTAKYGSLDNIKYFPMDISLWDETGARKITDTTGLSVDITIPIPDGLIPYAGNNKVAGVVDSQLDELSPKFVTIDNVPCISFRAMHFSPYTVYVDTTNLSATSVPDETPKTGDGIHPKWFLSVGLASLSVILFLKKDKRQLNTKLA